MMLSQSKYLIITCCFILLFNVSCAREEENLPVVETYAGQYRPQIHFSSKYNWINDPNGLVYHDGEYHLFFQHNPFGSGWGYMSWGHAVSSDLIHWKQLNVVMKPDAHGDIFSGCVVVDKNNTAGFGTDALIAVYTSAGSSQAQSIAFSVDKGRTFIKYRDNPVLDNPGRPDFRDPKVFWYAPSQQWIMSLATGQTISFYRSPDLKNWTKLSEFGVGVGSHDGVWECPDIFPLKFADEIKWVLLVSINPGAPNGGSGTQYFIGNFNGTSFSSDSAPYPLWVDYGKDNYAGITWENIPESDGRRIQIAWMNNWQYAGAIPTYSSGGNGARSSMTLPRELSIEKHVEGYFYLRNKVVTEIEGIATEWTNIPGENVAVGLEKQYLLNIGNEKSYHLRLTTTLTEEQVFTLSLQNDNNDESKIQINKKKNQVNFYRNNSGEVNFSGLFSGMSSGPLNNNSESITLDIYVDQSSIEIVANDGELTLTHQVFPSSLYNKIKVSVNTGTSFFSVKYRTLNSIWK